MLDREKIITIQAELKAVLDEFAKKHDLVAGNLELRWQSNSFKISPQFTTKESNPNAVDPRFLIDLRRNGSQYGLKENMIGSILVLAAKRGQIPRYKFVGMRASKAVCINEGDNKPYLFDASFIGTQIALQHPAA